MYAHRLHRPALVTSASAADPSLLALCSARFPLVFSRSTCAEPASLRVQPLPSRPLESHGSFGSDLVHGCWFVVGQVEEGLGLHPAFLKVLKLFLVMGFFAHLFACVMFATSDCGGGGSHEQEGQCWVDAYCVGR